MVSSCPSTGDEASGQQSRETVAVIVDNEDSNKHDLAQSICSGVGQDCTADIVALPAETADNEVFQCNVVIKAEITIEGPTKKELFENVPIGACIPDVVSYSGPSFMFDCGDNKKLMYKRFHSAFCESGKAADDWKSVESGDPKFECKLKGCSNYVAIIRSTFNNPARTFMISKADDVRVQFEILDLCQKVAEQTNEFKSVKYSLDASGQTVTARFYEIAECKEDSTAKDAVIVSGESILYPSYKAVVTQIVHMNDYALLMSAAARFGKFGCFGLAWTMGMVALMMAMS